MPGDVTPLNTAGGDEARVRKGPRHAAPRKSLLTKLQMPAGKAMALAAMPTAVFVGMGLTPKLALADDKDIPFAPGPCVTRSDEPSESPSASESAKPSEEPSDDASGKPSEELSDGPTEEPSEKPSADARQQPKPSASPSASDTASAPQGQADPAPAPTETKNPLDPLGLGSAIKDLFDGPDKEPAATPTPSDTAKPTEEPSEPAADTPAEPEEPAKETSEPSAKAEADAAGSAASKTEKAIREAAEKAGATVEELDEQTKGLDPVKDDDIPEGADGKPRFPCPTADPEALAAAEQEPGVPTLPDDPWILESSLLTLTGLDYKGIVEVRTGSGKTKKVLKFTASKVDIKDLHQLVVGPNGTTAHVQAEKGSTSKIRNGTVTMYTEELKGHLFGLIPVTFSPKTPPPLNVPFAFFTHVKVTQAGQFGGTLSVPGLHNYFTGGKN
ncbi:hypothetical protein [Streptomyces sp. NPDC059176]|uniref:hypothetical protein n=1 Tax=unclassified Streptomyces TaxID=2593676 RepID=UPI00368315A6